ncbi:hypothetical protein P9314_02830 [Paenibacillus validus]|uniref:hypothetical protein n=1 Tax=Paenibacillus TaxID=44249 RepID=UPI000FD9BBB6|nr:MULTISPECIES: hypothetical protein [Paenibacillus]MED4599638.1 hypothetical protein [Paenibacillus validus]MED4604598.1 hypothetical protein [Paenibacillus validus]
MDFPPWFRQAIQGRLDDVSARIEYNPELNRIRAEESKAFQVLFAGMDIGRMPEFAEWEDKHHFKQAIMNEWLYLQGMKDGIQLAVALLSPSVLFDDETPVESDRNDPEA